MKGSGNEKMTPDGSWFYLPPAGGSCLHTRWTPSFLIVASLLCSAKVPPLSSAANCSLNSLGCSLPSATDSLSDETLTYARTFRGLSSEDEFPVRRTVKEFSFALSRSRRCPWRAFSFVNICVPIRQKIWLLTIKKPMPLGVLHVFFDPAEAAFFLQLSFRACALRSWLNNIKEESNLFQFCENSNPFDVPPSSVSLAATAADVGKVESASSAARTSFFLPMMIDLGWPSVNMGSTCLSDRRTERTIKGSNNSDVIEGSAGFLEMRLILSARFHSMEFEIDSPGG
ncbi:hypothetical protein ACFE04_019716 [Oxalis oulophora]